MEITPQLRDTLTASLTPRRAGNGYISASHARKAVGQAQRLARDVPEAQPWASAMSAAFTGALHVSATGHRTK